VPKTCLNPTEIQPKLLSVPTLAPPNEARETGYAKVSHSSFLPVTHSTEGMDAAWNTLSTFTLLKLTQQSDSQEAPQLEQPMVWVDPLSPVLPGKQADRNMGSYKEFPSIALQMAKSEVLKHILMVNSLPDPDALREKAHEFLSQCRDQLKEAEPDAFEGMLLGDVAHLVLPWHADFTIVSPMTSMVSVGPITSQTLSYTMCKVAHFASSVRYEFKRIACLNLTGGSSPYHIFDRSLHGQAAQSFTKRKVTDLIGASRNQGGFSGTFLYGQVDGWVRLDASNAIGTDLDIR
jgi:hypothetical protein